MARGNVVHFERLINLVIGHALPRERDHLRNLKVKASHKGCFKICIPNRIIHFHKTLYRVSPFVNLVMAKMRVEECQTRSEFSLCFDALHKV